MFCCDPSYNDPYQMALVFSALCVGGGSGHEMIIGNNDTEGGDTKCFVSPVVSNRDEVAKELIENRFGQRHGVYN